jgi:hypothetical protein
MTPTLHVLATLLLLQDPRLDVRIDATQARAVIARDWNGVVASEAYRRLRQRDSAFNRPIVDSVFKKFAMSDSLDRPSLEFTLNKWLSVDPSRAAAKALAYLPAATTIRARIYPVIKPRSNSFVWEASTNPAIFLYLDPAVTNAQFERTLAHELHHIGMAAACPRRGEGVAAYAGTFAEGRAVLAAAGSPNVHPHVMSPDSERAIWDRDYRNIGTDMRRLERYFAGIADGTLSEKDASAQFMQFVATDSVPQGAFYTVGYLMSKTVEEQLGREKLVATLCDPIQFLRDYNAAAIKARRSLPLWSPEFLRKLP